MNFESPFPPDVAFAVEPWSRDVDALRPTERAGLSEKAIEKRRREYVAGRIAARRALGVAGVVPAPAVPRGTDRAPIWPSGWFGTITHTSGWALAAVAPASGCGGLGLDLEFIDSTRTTNIGRYIADADEQAWIGDDRAALITVFSAKEAVFKAFYPRVGAYFGYDAVTLAPPADGRMVATLRRALGRGYPAGAQVEISTRRYPENLVLSSVWLARET